MNIYTLPSDKAKTRNDKCFVLQFSNQGQRELRLFNLRNRNSEKIESESIEQASARRLKNAIRTSLARSQGIMNRKRELNPSVWKQLFAIQNDARQNESEEQAKYRHFADTNRHSVK